MIFASLGSSKSIMSGLNREYRAKRFEVEDAGKAVENALSELERAKKSLNEISRKKIAQNVRCYINKIIGRGSDGRRLD